MDFRDLQDLAVRHAQEGWTLDEIDAHDVEPSGLSDEEKAAVWITARAEIASPRATPRSAPRRRWSRLLARASSG